MYEIKSWIVDANNDFFGGDLHSNFVTCKFSFFLCLKKDFPVTYIWIIYNDDAAMWVTKVMLKSIQTSVIERSRKIAQMTNNKVDKMTCEPVLNFMQFTPLCFWPLRPVLTLSVDLCKLEILSKAFVKVISFAVISHRS